MLHFSHPERFHQAARTLAAIALGLAVSALVLDYVVARHRLPADKELLERLELAVRQDAANAPVLTQEYERQREATLARRRRADIYTLLVIASGAIFLISAKLLASLRGTAPPTLEQIIAHRAADSTDSPGWGRLKRPAAAGNGAGTDIDLSFVDQVVAEEGRSREAAVVLLQRIQKHYRYLPDEALKRVCELTDVTPAQIEGLSSFYAQFRRSPVGRYVIKVCRGTACHVAGASGISEEVRRYLLIPEDADTDPQREFTVDHVACLGCCSLAPVLMIEDETRGGLSPASAPQAIEAFRRGRRS